MHPDSFLVLIKFIAAHFIGDFILQPDLWVKEKHTNKWKSKYLYYHCFTYTATVYIFIANWTIWQIPLIILLTHIAIDSWKLYRSGRMSFFIVDQALHLVVLLVVWIIFFREEALLDLIVSLFNNSRLWILITGYTIVIWPASKMVMLATARWKKMEEDEIGKGSQIVAGKWIGMMERILILTFVLINHYELTGFLIAAKSVYRFGDIRSATEKNRAEYYLIGTLLSFIIAFFTGAVIKFLIPNF